MNIEGPRSANTSTTATDSTMASSSNKIPVRILYSIRNDNPKSRSWRDFESEHDMAAELVDYYEEYLACISGEGDGPKTYKSDDLFLFLEEFFDELVMMVKENIAPCDADLWAPYGLPRIKESLYTYFWSLLEEKPTSKHTAQELNLAIENIPLPSGPAPDEIENQQLQQKQQQEPPKRPSISPLHKHIENLFPQEDDLIDQLDYSDHNDYHEKPMEV